MSVESGVLVGRRSRGEIERLVGQYGSSGMGRAEFCRSQVLALSTLGRHLRKQQSKPGDVRSKGVERSGLMAWKSPHLLYRWLTVKCPLPGWCCGSTVAEWNSDVASMRKR
jgi:hypothetical protein